jgi:hypothetical protein
MQLHLGSGKQNLEGWINIDSQPLKGVDWVLDVTLRQGATFLRDILAK